MQRGGDVPRTDERRAVGRWGRGLGLGLAIGGTIGVAAGLGIGLLAFEGTTAVFAATLAGAIFGTLVGAFVGGMSTLEDPPPGEEVRAHDPGLGSPGVTHGEQDPPAQA
jgi:hypothetical protein